MEIKLFLNFMVFSAPQSKSCMIRAITTRIFYAFSRTVQSDIPV